MPPLPRPPVLRRRRPHGLPRLSPSLAPRPAAVVRALWATGAAVRRLPSVHRLAGGPAPRSFDRVARRRRAGVLVDDVFTTGGALGDAARAVWRAGVITVLGVTFGRAVLPDFCWCRSNVSAPSGDPRCTARMG